MGEVDVIEYMCYIGIDTREYKGVYEQQEGGEGGGPILVYPI